MKILRPGLEPAALIIECDECCCIFEHDTPDEDVFENHGAEIVEQEDEYILMLCCPFCLSEIICEFPKSKYFYNEKSTTRGLRKLPSNMDENERTIATDLPLKIVIRMMSVTNS